MGRKPWIPTPKEIAHAEALASRGLTLEQIALSMGVSSESIRTKRKTFKDLDEAIARGKSKGLADIANTLFEKAKAGDTTAMIFYLKTRDPERWNEKRVLEVTGAKGGPIQTAHLNEAQVENILNNIGFGEYVNDDAAEGLVDDSQ